MILCNRCCYSTCCVWVCAFFLVWVIQSRAERIAAPLASPPPPYTLWGVFCNDYTAQALVSINPETGQVSLLKNLTNLSQFSSMPQSAFWHPLNSSESTPITTDTSPPRMYFSFVKEINAKPGFLSRLGYLDYTTSDYGILTLSPVSASINLTFQFWGFRTDPITEIVYCLYYSQSIKTFQFASINITTGEVDFLANLPNVTLAGDITATAYDYLDHLYFVVLPQQTTDGGEIDALLTLSIKDNSAQCVSFVNLTTADVEKVIALFFDVDTRRLLAVTESIGGGWSHSLYVVDATNGVMSLLAALSLSTSSPPLAALGIYAWNPATRLLYSVFQELSYGHTDEGATTTGNIYYGYGEEHVIGVVDVDKGTLAVSSVLSYPPDIVLKGGGLQSLVCPPPN